MYDGKLLASTLPARCFGREFSDVGFILFHDTEELRGLVVLDAQWMINQITCVHKHTHT